MFVYAVEAFFFATFIGLPASMMTFTLTMMCCGAEEDDNHFGIQQFVPKRPVPIRALRQAFQVGWLTWTILAIITCWVMANTADFANNNTDPSFLLLNVAICIASGALARVFHQRHCRRLNPDW